MKIRPVILCGGDGTRLWPNQKKHQAKQFIDFGGWTLIQKTLERIKNPIFDHPIISTNLKYLKQVRLALKKNKVNKYINSFNDKELKDLDSLLNIDDDILYKWYLDNNAKELVPVSNISQKLKHFKL